MERKKPDVLLVVLCVFLIISIFLNCWLFSRLNAQGKNAPRNNGGTYWGIGV